jgi:hypothetical protein
MKKYFKLVMLLAILLTSKALHAQGDYNLCSKGKVNVTWRLVSDFQPTGATCWGFTYHVFVYNGNNYQVILKGTKFYQDGDGTTGCSRGGSISLDEVAIPAGGMREYTFRVGTTANYIPSSPGYSFNWYTNYREQRID